MILCEKRSTESQTGLFKNDRKTDYTLVQKHASSSLMATPQTQRSGLGREKVRGSDRRHGG